MLSCLCNRQSQFLVRLTLDAQCIHLLRGGEQFRCCRDQCRIWSGEIAVAVQAPHVGSAFVWPKHNPSWFLVRRKAFGLPRALCQFAHSLSSAPNTAVKRDGLRPPVTLCVLPLCRADKIRRLRCRHPAVAEELPVLHRHHAQLLVFVRVARRPCREVVGGLESVLPASFAKAVHQGRQWRDVRLLLCAHFRLRSCAGQNPSVVCDLRKKPRRPHTSVVSRHIAGSKPKPTSRWQRSFRTRLFQCSRTSAGAGDRRPATRRGSQFSLFLAIILVVLVIFLFLRNLSATIIPSLALPMSIIGTFAVMYLLGYTEDNLSLLALTLSVGFVVDDAIVMLENIVRHLEMGKTPLQAALDGSREIGFTIFSMTLSLAAVFIPILFMGGVVGRLLHEFAVVITVAILVSGIVSLTLTPMACSRFLRPPTESHGRLYATSERVFEGMLHLYDRTLRRALQHPR